MVYIVFSKILKLSASMLLILVNGDISPVLATSERKENSSDDESEESGLLEEGEGFGRSNGMHNLSVDLGLSLDLGFDKLR